MTRTVQKYLRTRSVHSQFKLLGASPPGHVSAVIVIPALAESQHLGTTLAALAHCSTETLCRSLVICVVNNRDENHSDPSDREDNRKTLLQLEQWAQDGYCAPLTLNWIDASSPGQCLPAGEGVGLARKIGLDHGLALLSRNDCAFGAPRYLVNLDADSHALDGYLDALHSYYASAKRHGGYAAYAHRLEGSGQVQEAMIAYELYMRYHELHLRWAGSPYAWPALGSIISCTADAYAAAGGMNRHCAGEDFYFMQQLRKTGTLEQIPHATIFPSGRLSSRTPFGTGPHLKSGAARRYLHHPEAYQILKEWLALPGDNAALSPERLMLRSEELSPLLMQFLTAKEFPRHWEKIYRQHGRGRQLHRHFHSWFDGLRTIQWLHYFRDHGKADLLAKEAFTVLQQRISFPEKSLQQGNRELLETLRLWKYTG